jgi:hypothetical protein
VKVDVLMAVSILFNVFCDVTRCSPVDKHRSIGVESFTFLKMVILKLCTDFSGLPKVLHMYILSQSSQVDEDSIIWIEPALYSFSLNQFKL